MRILYSFSIYAVILLVHLPWS